MLSFKEHAHVDSMCQQMSNVSLDIKREHMPQIADFSDFRTFLLDKGIGYSEHTEIPHVIKPTQGEYNPEKIKWMTNNPAACANPILVSQDDYCIDGHHRYIAAHITNTPLNVLKIMLPIKDCLELIKDYDKVTTKTVHEQNFGVTIKGYTHKDKTPIKRSELKPDIFKSGSLWTLIWLDKEGNQIGDAEYDSSKARLQRSVKLGFNQKHDDVED